MFDKKAREMETIQRGWDIFVSVVSFVVAILVQKNLNPLDQSSFITQLSIFPSLLTLLIVSLSYFDAYRSPRLASKYFYISSLAKAMFITLGLLLVGLFFLKIQYVSRLVIFIYAGISMVGMISARLIMSSYFRRAVSSGEFLLKVLIIGSGERALTLCEILKNKTEWGLDIVGYIDIEPEMIGKKVNGGKILGTIDDISIILKQQIVDEVIVAMPRTLLTDVDKVAQVCDEEGVKFRFMADIFNLAAARISLEKLGGVPILTLESVALDESKLVLKRIFDFVVTVLFMPFFLPIMGLIAISIKLDDGGPVLFVQERVGLKKRLFPLYKFRTMHVNAELMLKDIEHLNEAEGPNFKIANDPRITRIGKFLRSTSLDELPQLFNVLSGRMSLVGPRPMSIRDVDLFDKGIQRKRFSVKPGITCIWQISGRSQLSFSKWLELDLEYIDNWSFTFDLLILLKTIPVVLLRKGAM